MNGLKDLDIDIRWTSLQALGNLGIQHNCSSIMKLLKYEKSDYVKEAAVQAIGNLKCTSAVTDLMNFVKEDEPRIGVFEESLYALAKIGDTRVIPELLDIANKLNEKSYGYDRNAYYLLGAVSEFEDPGNTDILIKFFNETKIPFTVMSVMVLSKINDPRADVLLKKALSSDDLETKAYAEYYLWKRKQYL